MDKKTVVVATFGSERLIRVLINKLLEMGLEETDISAFISEKFGHLSNMGPLRGATSENLDKKLIHVGLSTDLARNFKSYINDGGALIAVSCDEYDFDDVMDLLKEAGASEIQVAN